MRPTRRPVTAGLLPAPEGGYDPATAPQLRLALTPPCEWHRQEEARARGAPPCPRDAQVTVTDPVRGRGARCCTTHGLTLVALWRQSVPNRRRNAGRVALAWLPDVPRRVLLARAVGARRRRGRRATGGRAVRQRAGGAPADLFEAPRG